MLKYLYNPDFFIFEWTIQHYAHLSWASLLVVIILFQRFKTPVHRRIFFFVLYSVLMEYFSTDDDVKGLFGGIGTSPIYHLLTPGLFFFMTYIFADLFYKGKRRLIGIGCLVTFVLISIVTMFWTGLEVFPTVPVGIYSLTGIMLSVAYFLSLLNSLEIEYLEREPMFWVATGLLVYFSGNFLIWIGYNFLTYDRDFFNSIYSINTMLTILMHGFLLLAIFLNPNRNEHQKQLTKES